MCDESIIPSRKVSKRYLGSEFSPPAVQRCAQLSMTVIGKAGGIGPGLGTIKNRCPDTSNQPSGVIQERPGPGERWRRPIESDERACVAKSDSIR